MIREYRQHNILRFAAIGIAASVIVAFSLRADAQILSRGDLFGPGAPPEMIGVELGLGSHAQQGTYQAACRCEFGDGSLTSFLGGVMFELPLSYEWTIGLGAKFDFSGLNNSTIVQDTATIELTQPVDTFTTTTMYLHRTGTVRETFLTFTPFVRYEFYRNGPFVQVGPGIGLVLSSSFKHTRDLISSSTKLDDGTVVNNLHFQNGTSSETLEDDSKIPNINTLQLSLLATIGYDIPVGDNSIVAPMLTYSLPFTPVRPNILANDWKIQTIYFTLGLKYKID